MRVCSPWAHRRLAQVSVFPYLLPPLTGFLAYLRGGDESARFHSLQAVAFGTVLPLVLYGASWVSALATRVAAAAGFALWLVLIVAAARGKTLSLPLIGPLARRAARYELERDRPAR